MSSNLVEHTFTSRGDVRTVYEDKSGNQVQALVIFPQTSSPIAYLHSPRKGEQYDYVLYAEWAGNWRAVYLYRLGTHLHKTDLDDYDIEGVMAEALDDARQLWEVKNNPPSRMLMDELPDVKQYDPDNGSEL